MSVSAFTKSMKRVVGVVGAAVALLMWAGAVPAQASSGSVQSAAPEVTGAVTRFLCGVPLPEPLAQFKGKLQCVNGWQ